MTRSSSLRLASVNPSPAIRRVRKPTPLISSEARRKEREGERFYPKAHLKPSDLPITYRSLTSYPARVERKRWRSPVAVIVGAVFGLVVLGATQDAIAASLIGAAVGGAVWISDGWRR